ncbi:MAG: hypothetical protein ACQEXJ_17260 [Myxococcota bacterium]
MAEGDKDRAGREPDETPPLEDDAFVGEQPFAEDVDSIEGLRDARKGMSDGLRKAVASGIRTVLSADDVLREALPRDVLSYMMRQTDTAKDEVVRVIGVQTRKFLENLDLAGEIQKILTSVSFEVKTEIRFIPNDQSVMPRPNVKMRSRARGTREREDAPEEAEEEAPVRDRADRPERERPTTGRRSRLGAAVDRALGVFGREDERGWSEPGDLDDLAREDTPPEASEGGR